VLRRLDCVLEPSKDKVLEAFKTQKAIDRNAELADKVVRRKAKLPFINTSKYTFAKLVADPNGLAANLLNYIKGFSPEVRHILDKFDFDKEIEKLDKANRLFEVMQKFAAIDLHPDRVPDAWIAWDKTRVGFEIPFNRHFYVYKPPRDLAEIEGELKTLEMDIVRMLGKLTA
jgi:type I restriction-modification system DNA methylase subunit